MKCDEKRIDGLIERYFRGTLPNNGKSELARHLSKCTYHRKVFETEGSLTDSLIVGKDIMKFEVLEGVETHVPTALMVLFCECETNLEKDVAERLERHIKQCASCANEHAAIMRMMNVDVEMAMEVPMSLKNRLLKIPEEIDQRSEKHATNEYYQNLTREVKMHRDQEQKVIAEKSKLTIENKNTV